MLAAIRRAGALLTAILMLFLLVGAILLALAPRAPDTPASVASLEEMEAFLHELVRSQNPPGLSVAVVQGDEVVYEKGFGFADAPAGIAATPQTVYKWWSLTKVLTALAVLQLDERGLVDLDDEVAEHLPSFRPTYRGNSPPVRVRQLLNHSAGLRNLRFEVLQWTHLEGTTGRGASELLAESFERYSRLRSVPGRRGYYSNFGYLVLGALVEKASGRTYEEYLTENVLEPLGMELTGFEITGAMRSHLASGCHPVVDLQTLFLPSFVNLDAYVREIVKGRIWFEPFYLDANSYGGLMGPVSEATKLLRAFLGNGSVDGHPVLSSRIVRRMLEEGGVPAGSSPVASPADRRAGMRHGFGWWVFPRPAGTMYEHTGAGPGFATIFRLYPESSLGIAVFANGTSLDRRGIADRFYELFGPSAAESS